MSLDSRLNRSAVRDLLARYLFGDNPEPGGREEITVRGPVYAGYNSRVFHVQSPALPFPCALKACLKSRTLEIDSDTARRQFVTLRNVKRAMPADSDYRVPEPCLLMEPEGALLVEWVAGRTFAHALFAFPTRLRHVQALLVQAAAWLQCFHAGHLLQAGLLNTGERLDDVSNDCQLDAIKGKLFDRCRQSLLQTAAAAGSIPLPRSWLHGDFKPTNLVLSRRRVFGMDVHALSEHVVIYDIAQFLNDIELNLNRWKRPRFHAARPILFRGVVERYFEGSGIDSNDVSLPLAWVRLYMLLYGWSEARAMPVSIRRRYIERQYRDSIAAVVFELERLGSAVAPARKAMAD